MKRIFVLLPAAAALLFSSGCLTSPPPEPTSLPAPAPSAPQSGPETSANATGHDAAPSSPNKLITEERAIEIAKASDRNAKDDVVWTAQMQTDVKIDGTTYAHTWRITADYPPYHNKMIVVLDAQSGAQLMIGDQEPPGR